MAKSPIPRKTMTPKQVKHILDNQDITQAMIAEECKVSAAAVSLVINAKSKSHKILCHIAGKLNLTKGEILDIKLNPEETGPNQTHHPA